MPDDGLYGAVGRVCGGIGVGQDVSRVEYIQALVFHGAHIEIVGGHDHEAVQIQFQAKTVFIPLDRAVQAVQGRSEEHTSELQSLMRISYAVFCLTKKKKNNTHKI